MRRTSQIIFLIITFCFVNVAAAQPGNTMRQRVRRVKAATVRVFVKGNPVGTGFAVAEDMVATAFHVVQEMTYTANGQTQITFASEIEVQLQDGRRLPATPHSSVTGQNLQYAIGKDITVLTVPVKNLKPLRLGNFKDVLEGDYIYLAGYPLRVEQVVVSSGMLSTKWKVNGYLGQGGQRDVAWLDITMNKGNSGGPLLLLAEDPSNDVVVGIANFSLNPFAESAEKFAGIAAEFPGNVMLMGIDFKRFSMVIGAALASQSHGVGGCIAIDYLNVLLP